MSGKRNWKPCRECGNDHKNPASSSLCGDCGRVLSLKRVESQDSESIRSLLDSDKRDLLYKAIEHYIESGQTDINQESELYGIIVALDDILD